MKTISACVSFYALPEPGRICPVKMAGCGQSKRAADAALLRQMNEFYFQEAGGEPCRSLSESVAVLASGEPMTYVGSTTFEACEADFAPAGTAFLALVCHQAGRNLGGVKFVVIRPDGAAAVREALETAAEWHEEPPEAALSSEFLEGHGLSLLTVVVTKAAFGLR